MQVYTYKNMKKIVLLLNEGRRILKMRMYAMWHVPQGHTTFLKTKRLIVKTKCKQRSQCNEHSNLKYKNELSSKIALDIVH